jgi:hypothetical protein
LKGVGKVLGTEEAGPVNAVATRTKTLFAETPAIVTLATISPPGPNVEADGHATLWLSNSAGWQIDLHLVTDALGNTTLFGTAIPATVNTCVPTMFWTCRG